MNIHFIQHHQKSQNNQVVVELFQPQMGLSFPFLRANNLRSSLLNIRARIF